MFYGYTPGSNTNNQNQNPNQGYNIQNKNHYNQRNNSFQHSRPKNFRGSTRYNHQNQDQTNRHHRGNDNITVANVHCETEPGPKKEVTDAYADEKMYNLKLTKDQFDSVQDML